MVIQSEPLVEIKYYDFCTDVWETVNCTSKIWREYMTKARNSGYCGHGTVAAQLALEYLGCHPLQGYGITVVNL